MFIDICLIKGHSDSSHALNRHNTKDKIVITPSAH